MPIDIIWLSCMCFIYASFCARNVFRKVIEAYRLAQCRISQKFKVFICVRTNISLSAPCRSTYPRESRTNRIQGWCCGMCRFAPIPIKHSSTMLAKHTKLWSFQICNCNCIQLPNAKPLSFNSRNVTQNCSFNSFVFRLFLVNHFQFATKFHSNTYITFPLIMI